MNPSTLLSSHSYTQHPFPTCLDLNFTRISFPQFICLSFPFIRQTLFFFCGGVFTSFLPSVRLILPSFRSFFPLVQHLFLVLLEFLPAFHLSFQSVHSSVHPSIMFYYLVRLSVCLSKFHRLIPILFPNTQHPFLVSSFLFTLRQSFYPPQSLSSSQLFRPDYLIIPSFFFLLHELPFFYPPTFPFHPLFHSHFPVTVTLSWPPFLSTVHALTVPSF